MHPQPTVHPEVLVLNKAIVNVSKILDLKQIELSEILGTSPTQTSRLFNNHSILTAKTKEWECAMLLIRAFRSLDTLLGEDKKQCKEWFKSNNHHLGGKPIDIVKKVDGLVKVVEYLDTMRGLA